MDQTLPAGFLSYHNRCIASDCCIAHTEADLVAVLPRCTLDDCGNIVAIDGRAVTGGDIVYRLA